MIWTRVRARWSPFFILATVTTVFAVGPMPAQSKPATYEGKAVRIGHGTAHTVVRTDANGKPASISVVFTPGMLEGLPKVRSGTNGFEVGHDLLNREPRNAAVIAAS
jgi:hypothetical protein